MSGPPAVTCPDDASATQPDCTGRAGLTLDAAWAALPAALVTRTRVPALADLLSLTTVIAGTASSRSGS